MELSKLNTLMNDHSLSIDDLHDLIKLYFDSEYRLPNDSTFIFAKLWQLENILRDLVYLELRSYSNDWINLINNVISGNDSNKKRDPKESDKKLGYMSTTQNNPLSYKSLGELWKVIINKTLWNDIFQYYFPPKNILETKLNELYVIRNRIGHSRKPHDDDVDRVNQFLKDIDNKIWEFITSYHEYRSQSIEDFDVNLFLDIANLPTQIIELYVGSNSILGRNQYSRLNITFDASVRPWVREKIEKLQGQGVIYHVTFTGMFMKNFISYEKILEQTDGLHDKCLHILLPNRDDLVRSIELTFSYSGNLL